LVGRERKLHTLQARIAELRAGHGQIVSVIGEAGLGKSRLVAELRQPLLAEAAYVDEETGPAVGWYEGRSLSYQTAVPYAMLASLFGSMFGLSAEDSDTQKYDKIRAAIPAGAVDEIAPFVATLMDIKLGG